MKPEPDKNQIVISTYNKIADQYTAFNFDDPSNLPYVDKLLSYLSVHPKMLDVGCGPGNLVQYLLQKDCTAEGIDLSEKMIEIAKEKVPEGTFRLMDMRHLEYANETFDGITSLYSLIHIPSAEIPAALGECSRVLKPGGHMLVIAQEGEADKIVSEPFDANEKMFINFFTSKRLLQVLTTAGFTLVEKVKVQSPETNNFTKSDTIICMIVEKIMKKD